MQTGHYLPRALPEKLRELATLALDLRWSWHHGTDELWQAVDRELWEATGNPWLVLESVADRRLRELARDEHFLWTLRQQVTARNKHYRSETWFDAEYGSRFTGQIAYFCMEFGLDEALPIYSGGLGVLAGDHLKTACDLGVPIVGVGLLYQQGYFRQALDAHGEQLAFYPFNDPTMLPVVPLRDDQGEWVRVSVELPGRALHLRTWHAQVGRRSLLLLDSNDLLNDPGDRGITSELYGGGSELRLQQEIVLGIGGWRLLHRLGWDCRVCHLNEGHAAFAILERTRLLMEGRKLAFRSALHVARAGTLFTSHTPVDAGFDRFDPELFAVYFRDYAAALRVPLEALLALGRADAADAGEPFNMAYLAVRGAGAVNGVSRLHGRVSQGILQPLFPRWPRGEVPVGHITNGVHVPSWDSAAADALWTKACGKARWRGALGSVDAYLRQVSDKDLWDLRSEGRHHLVQFLRKRLVRQHRGRGAGAVWLREFADVLDPDVLTLGFARRFTEYKRTNLLLHDRQRLRRLLFDRDRPVQLVIAGKAHPHDSVGKELLRQWQVFVEQAHGRVVFVEDYDLGVAEQLVQGVDLWLNTPRRPWEASGTSGMKVLVNGGVNFSELDGWWAEAFRPEVGWALGDGREHADTAASDAAEAQAMYRLLEDEVVPSFYQRDRSGLPREWIARVRESMARLTPQYSTNRMLREYVKTYYVPLADGFQQRGTDEANALEQWYRLIEHHWERLHFGNVTSKETDGAYQFEVHVYLAELPPEAIAVQLYAEPLDDGYPVCLPLQRDGQLMGSANAYVYRGEVPANRPASDYTPRIIPFHEQASVPLEAPFILWHR